MGSLGVLCDEKVIYSVPKKSRRKMEETLQIKSNYMNASRAELLSKSMDDRIEEL